MRPYARKNQAHNSGAWWDDAVLVGIADMSGNLSASRLDKLDPAMPVQMLKKYVEPYKLLVKRSTPDMKPRLPSSRAKLPLAGKFPQNTL